MSNQNNFYASSQFRPKQHQTPFMPKFSPYTRQECSFDGFNSNNNNGWQLNQFNRQTHSSCSASLNQHPENRVTITMDISYTEHSRLIGAGGHRSRQLMGTTGCTVHFPDGNLRWKNSRKSFAEQFENSTVKTEKSNSVTLTGPSDRIPFALRSIRLATSLTLSFQIPSIPNTITKLPSIQPRDPDCPPFLQQFLTAGASNSIMIMPTTNSSNYTIVIQSDLVHAEAVHHTAVHLLKSLDKTDEEIGTVEFSTFFDILPEQSAHVLGPNDVGFEEIQRQLGVRLQVFPVACYSGGPPSLDQHIDSGDLLRIRLTGTGGAGAILDARQTLINLLPISISFQLIEPVGEAAPVVNGATDFQRKTNELMTAYNRHADLLEPMFHVRFSFQPPQVQTMATTANFSENGNISSTRRPLNWSHQKTSRSVLVTQVTMDSFECNLDNVLTVQRFLNATFNSIA